MDKSYEGFLGSNLLWSGEQFGLEQFEIEYGKLDFSRLRPIPDGLRLGHQIEHVYLQLLKVSNHYKVLAHSIQLIEGKRTLGELDFVIKSLDTDEIIHLELAYKFYLMDPQMDGVVEGLVGPNRGDAFTYKLDKIKNKQMPLLFSDAARKRLKLDVDVVDQKVAFYGEIFLPYTMQDKDLGVLNQRCIRGSYMSLTQFSSEEFDTCKFHFPNKSEWVHVPCEDVKWMNFESAIELVKKRHAIYRSPMIWIKRGGGLIEKIFVTHW